MLTIYRRHLRKCSHRSEGRSYRRCHCPIWVDGFIDGRESRESLRLRDWQKAQEKIRDWEASGETTAEEEPVTVASACAEFLRDARARLLRRPTIYRYRLLLHRLRDFARQQGFRYVCELRLQHLRTFRARWRDRNISAKKNLERLRTFFSFCQDSEWIVQNPARKLKSPVITDPPTLPFSKEQMAAIFAACHNYPDRYNAVRLLALVLLLRYSGLRIRDGVTLRRDRIRNGKLFLYTAKTGTAVWCPLPPFVIDALEAVPQGGEFIFWSGKSKPKSCVGDWQRSLRRLFKLAGILDGHAHRFRDTFAVELLQAGVPLERVSMLLGHKSIKVTEKHYSPWIKARQDQLEADVRRIWQEEEEIPCLPIPSKGTPEVHRPKYKAN